MTSADVHRMLSAPQPARDVGDEPLAKKPVTMFKEQGPYDVYNKRVAQLRNAKKINDDKDALLRAMAPSFAA